MRKVKSFLSIALALMLVLGSICVPFAVSANEIFTDVNKDNTYYKAITELVGKGIIDGYLNEDGSKSFKPEATITRAEFSKLLSVTLNGNTVSAATTTKFADVNSDPTVSWAIPYIADASNSGIINGYEDGTFRAKNPVSYAEAVKMIVCALGYGPVVKTPEDGKWYDGYITTANSIGVTKSAYALAESEAPRGLVAQLIFNMTTTPMLEYKGVDSEGNPMYEQNDEVTIQGESVTGQVISVFRHTLSGVAEGLSADQIKIRTAAKGDMIFDVGSGYSIEQLNSYLGYDVEITYDKVSTGTPDIKTIVKSNTNKEYEFDSDKIISVDASGTSMKYEEGLNTKTLRISSAFDMIYNGKGVGSLTTAQKGALLSNLTGGATGSMFGSVKFVDCDSDSNMDVAFVTAYEPYFVSTITNSTYTIYDNMVNPAKSISFNPTVGGAEYTYKKAKSNGTFEENLSFNAISQNNVIAVATSNDNTLVEVVISDLRAEGSSSAEVLSMNNTMSRIQIGSGEYAVSDYYKNMYMTSTQEQTFSVGSKGTFYLDFTGKIAAVKISLAAEGSYGYLIQYAPGDMSTKPQIAIMTGSGASGYKIYDLASSVTVNGVQYSATALATPLSTSASTIYANGLVDASSPQAQLVKYQLAGNKITDLLLVGTNGITLSTSNPSAGYQFKTTANGFTINGTSVTVGPNTIVYFIPETNRTDSAKYTQRKGLGSHFVNNTSYKVEAYDIKNNTAGALVIYGKTKLINGATDAYVVTGVSSTTNMAGQSATKLTYYKLGGSESGEAVEKTSNIASGIKIGDIIKVSLDEAPLAQNKPAEIEELEKVYIHSATGGTLYSEANSNGVQSALSAATQELHVAYAGNSLFFNVYKGTLYSKSDSTINIAPGYINAATNLLDPAVISAAQPHAVNLATVPTYVYDITDTVNPVRYVENANELVDYETVISTTPTDGSAASEVVVIRKQAGNLLAVIIYR